MLSLRKFVLMKKLLFALPLLGLLWTGCSNDFEVTAPWKEVPVVYAILSAKDTANYVRVEKAFLDPEESALVVAQIADSLYYPADAITVFMEHVKTKVKVQLTRVDGNLDGHPRQPGTFATTPNWLYKLKSPNGAKLIAGDKYRLIVVRADGKKDITSVTTVPNEFIFNTPNPADIPPKITFQTDKTASLRWLGDTSSVLFDVDMVVRYRVEAGNGTTLLNRSIKWSVAKNLQRGAFPISTTQGPFYTTNYEVAGNRFFELIANQIKADDLAGIDTISNERFRYFEGIDLVINGGGSEIYQYLQTVSANSGLTGSEIISSYTNISEGYGVFTAKNTSNLSSLKVTELTINSMNTNPLTKILNFKYF